MPVIHLEDLSVDALTVMIENEFEGALPGFSTEENQMWTEFTHQANAGGASEILQDWVEPVAPMDQWTSEKQFQDMIKRQYKTGHDPFHAGVHMRREELLERLNAHGPEAFAADVGAKLAERAAELDIVKTLAQLTSSTALGYDGKALFAADHPDGGTQSNQNTGGGGQYWYLMALGGRARPLIRQDGEVDGGGFQIKSHVGPTTENFMQRKLFWSVEFWGGWHPGLWQTVYRSNQTLDGTNLDAAMQAMAAFKDYHGEQMGIHATHVVVGRSNNRAARELLNLSTVSGGGANVDAGIVQLRYSPRLP